MSVFRTGIRLTIRQVAPPALLLFVVYKYWIKFKDHPFVVDTVDSYRILYKKLKESAKKKDEWDYS